MIVKYQAVLLLFPFIKFMFSVIKKNSQQSFLEEIDALAYRFIESYLMQITLD